MSNEPGELSGRIGKYDIIRRVGKGAMGAVYQAHDPFLDRNIALKVMLPQAAEDPEQKHRFEREARAVARMMHPNVVAIFDLGYHTDGSPYIAMEYLQGRDLFQLMRDGPEPPFRQKVEIMLQALEGLGHAHKVGIVHRDIKPANIFLTEDGTVKIMDFGVARLTTASATGVGTVVGTAYYMSPEQVRGQLADGRSDIFATGAVLYEMMTGRRLFQAESVLSTLYKILNEEPKFELGADPDSQSILPVIKKALARSPDDRYHDTAELAGALRALPGIQTAAAAAVAVPEAATILPGTMPTPPPVKAPKVQPPLVIPEAKGDPTPLFALMRDIYVGGKSGQLHFVYGVGRKELRSLRIGRGNILLGSSDVQGERLGDVLVRYGVISQDDLDRATAVVLGQRRRLGIVLGELGILDRSRLEEHVALHIREILSNVVGRLDGTYVFEEMSADSVEQEDLSSRILPGFMILELTRRIQDPDLVQKTLGDRERILTLSTNPMLRFQKLNLTPTDGFLLSRIDGTLTAREVLQLIPAETEDTERSLFGLLLTGMIEYMPRTGGHRSVGGGPSIRYVTPPMHTPDPPHARTQTPSRPPAPLGGRPAAPRQPSTQPVSVPPPPSRPTEAATPSVSDRRRDIEDAYASLKSRDFYQILGVERGAPDTEVKAAYFRLARTFHPDAALDSALSELREKRSVVFVKLGEAFDALKTGAGRAQYDELHPPRRAPLPPPTPPPAPSPASAPVQSPANEAEARIAEAERLIAEGRYGEAVFPLESAIPRVQGATRHRGLVALARAYTRTPGGAKRAERTLQSVIDENPDYADAHFALGSLYRLMGLKVRAATAFKKTLELQPGLQAARAELLAVEPEPPPPPAAKPAPAPKTTVSDPAALLRKLFKR
jgi:tRNA A-37 threonylcarbamoyl transferase component Bud32